MNTIKKRNRIVLCLCSILVMFASIFAFIPFNKEIKVVKADTIASDGYNFVGSPILGSFSFWNGSSFVSSSGGYYSPDVNGISWALFYFSFNSDSNNLIRSIDFGYNHLIYYSSDQFDDSNYFVKTYDVYGINQTANNVVFTNFIDRFGGTPYYYYIDVIPSNIVFTNSLYYIKMGQPTRVSISIDNASTFITYYDRDSNYLQFKIFGNTTFLPENTYSCNMPERVYYFPYAFDDLTDNQYYNNGYTQGKSDGLTVGYTDGRDEGYSEGYQAGEDAGYWVGYQSAIDNDKYSFTTLISSVIDVPVKTFTSLFNFEILGVNLSGFFLGLLTCCIVIGVIRLIL